MKKILALVLALTMVLGMMAVPASAKFDDAADVQYTEAVDVVAATGIIEGYNNEFNPKGELTRAAGAKLVAYLELGATAAEALTAEKAPFADVPADHWAAGYIGWAAGKGYLNGVGNNNFAPDAPLTGLAYAKLLLCALGYDAAIEGFTGEGWEYNVLETALEIDLFDGNDDADFGLVATREEAALYTFNALQETMVEYENKGTQVTINGAVIATGASAPKAVYSDSTYNTNIYTGTADSAGKYTLELAEKRYTKLVKDSATGEDAFGRPAIMWTYDSEDVGTYADSPVVTYTANVKAAAVKADLKGYKVGTSGKKVEADIASGATSGNIVSTDGKSATSALTASGNTTFAALIADLTGKGVLVEIYAGSDKIIDDIVVINTYVGKVNDWNKADPDNDKKESVEIVTINGSNAGSSVANSTVKTTAFTEDDAEDGTIVLYTKADNVVKSAVAAEKVAGEITKVNGSTSFDLDGVTYNYSAQKHAAVSSSVVDDGFEYDIYLDKYGYMIYTEASEGQAGDYAYVAGAKAKADDYIADKYTYTAKLILADGSVVTAEFEAKDSKGDAISTAGSATANAVKGNIVEYTVDEDGVYTIVDKDEMIAVGYAKDTFKITKGSAKITWKTNNHVFANSKTQYVIAETETDGDIKATAYTGYNNVISVEDDKAGVQDTMMAYVVDDGIVKFIFVLDAAKATSSTSDDIVFVQYASKSGTITDAAYDNAYYTVNAIVKGEVVTLKVKSSLSMSGADKFVDGFTVDNEGLVTAWGSNVSGLTDYVVIEDATAVKAAKDDVITVNNIPYAYDEDTAVYEVENGTDDALEVSSVAELKTDDSATVDVITYKDVIVAIYVDYAE